MEKHPSAAKVPWVEPDVRTCVLPIGFHDDLAKKLDALKQMQEGESWRRGAWPVCILQII